jgi:hypothetical protein
MLSKKNGRTFYWRGLAGTIDLPPPGLRRISSPLHDERIIAWVEFFTHARLDGDRALIFKLPLSRDVKTPSRLALRSRETPR